METLCAKLAHLEVDLRAKEDDELPQLSSKRQVCSAWQSHIASKVSAPLVSLARR